MARFFWWTSWAASTKRPGSAVTYTNNWPHEPLVGNAPTSGDRHVDLVSASCCCSPASAALVWWYARRRDDAAGRAAAAERSAPRRHADAVAARHRQILLRRRGARSSPRSGSAHLTAHYGVEGQAFFGIPLAQWLPYAVTRTWHTQLGIFWIATAWLATGLFIAPAVCGHEPKFQRLGVNVLFVCLLIIVVGSMAGAVARPSSSGWATRRTSGSATRATSTSTSGRFWQIFLFVGLFLWLGLMVRALWPALRRPDENRHAAGAVPARLGGDRAVLRRRADVRHGSTQPRDRRVLALVGGPPLGRGLLRGLRHGRRSPSSSPAWACCARATATRRGAVRHQRSSCPAASSARSTTSTSPARRPSVLALGAVVQRAGGRAAGR